jgi:hypothetical protein
MPPKQPLGEASANTPHNPSQAASSPIIDLTDKENAPSSIKGAKAPAASKKRKSDAVEEQDMFPLELEELDDTKIPSAKTAPTRAALCAARFAPGSTRAP